MSPRVGEIQALWLSLIVSDVLLTTLRAIHSSMSESRYLTEPRRRQKRGPPPTHLILSRVRCERRRRSAASAWLRVLSLLELGDLALDRFIVKAPRWLSLCPFALPAVTFVANFIAKLFPRYAACWDYAVAQ